jgi:pimeloyl-ACP methyl ester carboxylesterase
MKRCTAALLVLSLVGVACLLLVEVPVRAEDAAKPEVKVSETLAFDKARLEFEVRGTAKPDQPTLVFIHAWCCNRTFWKPQLERFAKTHQVVALDLAGHGQSGVGDRKKWNMEGFGKDVAAVVKALKLKSVVLIGHSMGGPAMLEAAPLLKDELVGLVGVDCFGDPDEEYSAEATDMYCKPFEENFAKAMKETLLHEEDFFRKGTDQKLVERIVKTMTEASPEVGTSAFRSMIEFANDRQRPLMEQVKVPFVCINAKRDAAKAEAGKKHAPQFEIVVLPESGHFLMMEHPEEFNKLLAETLKGMAKPK